MVKNKVVDSRDLSVKQLHHLALIVGTYGGVKCDRFTVGGLLLTDVRKHVKKAFNQPDGKQPKLAGELRTLLK